MNAPDRFTCEELFRRLDDFVDRELTPEEMEEARRHVSRCELCASEFQFQSSMLQQLRDKLRRIDVPEDLILKVSAALEAARSKQERS